MSSVASPEGLIHLGMDTSKNTIVVATLLPGEESPVTDRVFNEEEAIRRLVGRFPDRSVLRAWYEAGPGGYDLYRLLTSMGVACQVVAPSLIPKGGSDKVKTDKRDSRRLARLGRAGELTPVRVPSPAEEAVRDLARARAVVLDDRRRARQRLIAVLMRHGGSGGARRTGPRRTGRGSPPSGSVSRRWPRRSGTTGPRWRSGRPSWPRSRPSWPRGRPASRWPGRWPGWAATGASPSWAG